MKIDLGASVRPKKLIMIIAIITAVVVVSAAIAITIYFVNASKAYIEYMNDDNIKIVAVDSNLPERLGYNKQIKFTVECLDGYEVDYVKVNDTKISPDGNGVYVVKIEKNAKSVNIIAKSKSATFIALNYSGTPTNTVQFDGDVFNPEGLTFTRLFSNGTTLDINNASLDLPVLSINKSVIVSYAGKSVIIEGITIVNTLTFDLEGMGTFNATNSSVFKTRYNLGDEVVYPKEEDITVKNGKKTGSLKGWELSQVTDSGNKIYKPEWNYFSDCNVALNLSGEQAYMLVTADILVSKNTADIKIVIGGKEFVPEITGNSVKKEILFEELNENISISSAGYKVNLYYNETGYVTVNSSAEANFSSGKYNYFVYTNEAGEFLVKKVQRSDFRIDSSNVHFNGTNLKFSIEVYDYITGEGENPDSTVRAKVYIGEHEVNAVIALDHFVQATFPLSEFTAENGLNKDTNYLLKVVLVFNGIEYSLDIPVGETDLNVQAEDEGYYYSLIKDEADKLYITQTVIPVPEVNITSLEINDKTLAVKGTATNVKTARISATTEEIVIYGETIRDIDGEFTLEFDITDLSANNNPTYIFSVVINESDTYTIFVPFITLEANLTLENSVTENEKIVYTFINNEGKLNISVNTIELTPTFNITGVQMNQDEETSDYYFVITGTCSNVRKIVLSCNAITTEAVITDGAFTISYDLSRLDANTTPKYFFLIINDSDDYDFMAYPEGFGLKDKYVFVSGDKKTTYDFRDENGIFALYKEKTETESYSYTITDITVDENYILTINGICTDVYSVYIALDYNMTEVCGSEGIDINNELYRFSTSIDLKNILPETQTNVNVYIYVNEIKKTIENIYFTDNEYIYNNDTYKYTYTFENTQYVTFTIDREEIIEPVLHITNLEMQGNNLVISGTYANIDSFDVDIYNADISVLSGIPVYNNGAFTANIDIFNLAEGNYTLRFVYNGENYSVTDEMNKNFTVDYDENNRKVFAFTGGENLALNVSLEQKISASIEITSANIYKDNGEFYLSVTGNATNISELYMVYFENSSERVTTDGDFTLTMNITEMPDNQFVYFTIRYTVVDSIIEETMFIDISAGVIESKVYEFYGNENILYSFEVNASETNNYLAIKLVISAYEQSYTVTSVVIDENKQTLTVEGTVAGIDKINIRIGSVTSDDATIESNTFVAVIDLTKINPDSMKQNVLIYINDNPENITGITLEKEEYTSENEKAVYTVMITYGFQGEIYIQREVDTSEVADYTISNVEFDEKLLTISGEYNGEGTLQVALVDENDNIFSTDTPTIMDSNAFTSTISVENLPYNHTYTAKLYIAIQDYYYTVKFDSQIETVTEEYEFDTDNTMVYKFSKTENNIIILNVKKVLNYDKTVNISSITLETIENVPYMVITGTLENVETITLVSESFDTINAVINDGTFSLKFNLLNITEEDSYTFRIFFDGIALDFMSGDQTLEYNLTETIINNYSFENNSNIIELSYVQEQIFIESIDVTNISVVSKNAKIDMNIQNVDRIDLVIDGIVGSSLNNPDGNVSLTFDLTRILLPGTYGITLNTNIKTYNLEYKLFQPVVYSYEQNNVIHTYTIKNNNVSDKVFVEYTQEEKIEYFLNIVNAYIDFAEDKENLCVEISSNVKKAYISIGDYAGNYYNINENNHTVIFDLKSITTLNTDLLIKVNSDDITVNVVNSNYFTVPETYSFRDNTYLISYTINQNQNNELYITYSSAEIPQPSYSNLEIAFNHDVSLEIEFTGECENVSNIIINIYYDGAIKNIIYPVIEDGSFDGAIDISQYEDGNYNIEIECINDYFALKEYIDFSGISFTTYSYTENNIKHTYDIKNVASKGVLNILTEPIPVLNFTDMYIVYSSKPYIYFEGNKQNITSLVISMQGTLAETVSDNGSLFVMRTDLSGMLINTDYDFDCIVNGSTTTKMTNTVLSNEEISYNSDGYRYTVSVKKVENSDILYINLTKTEIVNTYEIDTVYVRKSNDDYILTLEGTYQGENIINMYAVTEYDRLPFDYTVSGGTMKFEFNLNELFYEETARFVIKFNGVDHAVSFDYFDSEDLSYEITVSAISNRFVFSDDNGLIVTISQII